MMRSSRWRRALFIALCTAVLIALVPTNFRGAQARTRSRLAAYPQITYTAASMAVGTSGTTVVTVQTVPGYPFDPNTQVSISVGGASQITLITTSQGTLPSNAITIPEYPIVNGVPQSATPLTGPVPVSVVELNPPGGISPAPSASIYFYALNASLANASVVYHALYVGSSQTTSGGTVPLTAAGFATGSTVTFTIFSLTGSGKQQLGTVVADASGNANLSATIPSLPNGLYFIIASGPAPQAGGPTVSNVGAISVGPGPLTLSVNPSVVLSGQAIVLSGCGFTASLALTISINQPTPPFNSVTTVGTPMADSTGCLNFSFTVPTSIGTGNFFIEATSSNGVTTQTEFGQVLIGAASTAGVSLIATPSAVAPGAQIQLQGAGFSANVDVTISAFGTSFPTTTNASGSFTMSITVPLSLGLGSQVITATDANSHFTSTTITIGTAGITLSVASPTGNPGQQVFISGTGFGANEAVVVSLAPASANPTPIANTSQTFATTANGAISGSYTLPAVQPGTYILFALGQSSRIQALTPFTVTGSTTPTPIPTNAVAPSSPTPFPTNTPVALPSPGSAATTTYFAEGYTGTAAVNGKASFAEHLYLYNDGPAVTTVTTSYYAYGPGTAFTTVVEHDTLQPDQTTVRDVNADAGNDRNVSIVVQATAGVIAETVISRTAPNGTALDTGSSTGSSTLNQNWYLAEGYTGASIQEYLTLFNPTAQAVTASVQYLPSTTAAPPAQQVQLPANGRVTINVRQVYNGLVKIGSRNVAIAVTADHPIAVDRSMYWGAGSGSGKYGYSIGPAIRAGSTSQSFAYLPTQNGSQSFVTVLNPSSITATVTLSLQDITGVVIRTTQATVPPMQRYTFSVPTILPGSYGAITGVLTSGTVPVVAEAGLYFNGSPNIGSHPGLVVQGTQGANFGARAEVSPNGNAAIRVYNPTGLPERVQITVARAGTVTMPFDGTVFGHAARTLTIPAGTDPRGISVVSSGTVTAVLINGGDGSPVAYGGNMN